MVRETGAGERLRSSRQEGGTGSVSGATRTPRTARSPALPVLYQVPLDGPPGVMYMTEDGQVISAQEAQSFIAANSVRLVQGAPQVVQGKLVNGKFPTSLIPGVSDPNVGQFLSAPNPIFREGTTETGTDGGGGSRGASQSAEQTFQPIAPPVLDILQQLSARRQAVREASLANFGAVQGAAPFMVNPAARFFPGLEPEGLASIALGQASGKGTVAAESLIPTATREFFRVPLPGLASPQEPTLGSEFGGAMGLAKQILDAIRLFQTGTAQSTSSQSSSGGSGLGVAESAFNDILTSLAGAPAI